jgi:hypothetical protein
MDQFCRTLSDLGRPSDAMLLSTQHFTSAYTRWFSNPRAASFTPSNALNRNTAFTALAPTEKQ